MIETIILELSSRANYVGKEKIQTIYFGGGTPSLLTKEELKQILDKIHSSYAVASEVECTLEANPDDIDPLTVKDWKEIGINRLSIGLQSFKQSDLEWMNRAHDQNESLESVLIAKNAGFKNITVDLMYGLPDLTINEWSRHIDIVLDLGIQHISAYCLTVEPKTALSKWVKSERIIPANEDQQSEQFILLVNELNGAGYKQYEISNFGLEGFESKHNSNYWKSEVYIGIGPSAHSFNGYERQWNVANNQKYMAAVENGEPYFEIESLTPENRFNELILTGLRTTYGVDLKDLHDITSIHEGFHNKVSQFIQDKWMTKSGTQIYLTQEGRLKADYIVSELFRD